MLNIHEEGHTKDGKDEHHLQYLFRGFFNPFKASKIKNWRLDSNIDSPSLNKHLFNIIKILFLFKIFEDDRMGKFNNNIDLRKLDL